MLAGPASFGRLHRRFNTLGLQLETVRHKNKGSNDKFCKHQRHAATPKMSRVSNPQSHVFSFLMNHFLPSIPSLPSLFFPCLQNSQAALPLSGPTNCPYLDRLSTSFTQISC